MKTFNYVIKTIKSIAINKHSTKLSFDLTLTHTDIDSFAGELYIDFFGGEPSYISILRGPYIKFPHTHVSFNKSSDAIDIPAGENVYRFLIPHKEVDTLFNIINTPRTFDESCPTLKYQKTPLEHIYDNLKESKGYVLVSHFLKDNYGIGSSEIINYLSPKYLKKNYDKWFGDEIMFIWDNEDPETLQIHKTHISALIDKLNLLIKK